MDNSELNLDHLRKMYNKFRDTNEENIKIHVVSKFLEMIGYDSSEFYYEHSTYHKDGRADIAIKIDEINYLYVEVKAPNEKLDEKYQTQLAQYLRDRGLSWGILTNGKRFILFNDSITPLPNLNRPIMIDKIVFEIDIFDKRYKELIKYFTKESIFETKITNYFRDIAKFKALKFPDGKGSWEKYKSSLLSFFKYYADQQRRYRRLEEIRIDEFEDFLIYHMNKSDNSNGKSVNSNVTLSNIYSHFRSFLQVLEIKNPILDEKKKMMISRIEPNPKESVLDISEVLTEENIQVMLEFYDTGQYAIRNKTIFLLCLCFGLERSTIISLKKTSIKGDKLFIDNRELLLPAKIKELIENLLLENKSKKIKGDSLFYRFYQKQYEPISEGIANNIIDNLVKINKSWSILSPSNIRAFLIKEMFKNNYSIEEIVYNTGAELNSISKLISYDEIIGKVKSNSKKNKVHPFSKFLY